MLKKNRAEVGRHAKSYNYFQKTQVGSLEGTSPSPIPHNELPGRVRETRPCRTALVLAHTGILLISPYLFIPTVMRL